jgi:crotonobetainyl-CoA:carnitine CoA-transferase CaiB-like acyl-CoA transferase
VLCEFGAEVIRCETRLRGDGHRGEDPAKWNKNPDFMKLQRGKKSFTVNMQTPKGRRLVRELIKISDVLVENYGLGILEKWGFDWPQLKEINPSCILIRVKGMGCSGPHAADLTYGPNVGNTMATTYLWNYADATTATAEPRTQHPDFMGGVTGAFGVVLALIQRKKTGRGQWIDSARWKSARPCSDRNTWNIRSIIASRSRRVIAAWSPRLTAPTSARVMTAGASSPFILRTNGSASLNYWRSPDRSGTPNLPRTSDASGTKKHWTSG